MPGMLGTSLVLFVVSAAALSASELNLGPATSALRPADAKPARIPATPAGRMLASWLAAHNSGDRAMLERWLRRSFSEERLAPQSFRRSLDWYVESAEMFGELAERPYHIVEDEPHRLVAWFLEAGLEETVDPDPTRVIVVEIDIDPDDPVHLARGLGLGSLACELREKH